MKTSGGASGRLLSEGLVASLLDNQKAIHLLVEQFKHSNLHAPLVSFARAINRLSRREFLERLQSTLSDSWHCDARIVCSVGAGVEETRHAMLLGQCCDACEMDERLIINLYGFAPAGNLIPLVIFADSGVELEGMINIAPSPGVERDEAREGILHAASQILALAFRNLKLAAALMEYCPPRLRDRLSGVLAGFRGNSGRLADELAAIFNPAARPRNLRNNKVKERGFSRLMRFFAARIGVAWSACFGWLTTR